MKVEPNEWTPRDALLGSVFLVVGLLILACVVLAIWSGLPWYLLGFGWLVGPVFVLLGTNALYQSARSASVR